MLRAVDPRVVIIGNPTMPRLSAFEVSVQGGPVLWSKLSQPDGRNNSCAFLRLSSSAVFLTRCLRSPGVFPTNQQLVEALCRHLNKPVPAHLLQPHSLLYSQEGTRMGVW